MLPSLRLNNDQVNELYSLSQARCCLRTRLSILLLRQLIQSALSLSHICVLLQVRILVKVIPQSMHLVSAGPEGGGNNRISEDQIKCAFCVL